MLNLKRLLLFIALITLASLNSYSVVYNWNTMTAGSLTYTSGNMSAVITNTNFDTRGPQDPNGGANSGYKNPKYVSNQTIATYQGGGSNDYGLQGMVLGVDWPNLTSSTTVTITFANPVAGPVSFTLYDINTGSGFGFDPIWVDKVTLTGTNCAGTAIYPTITGCANTVSGTNNNIITGKGSCTNSTNTITFNSGTLKTITLTYGSGASLASGYGTDPDPQYIIISSITTGNDLSATIAPNTGIGCSASSVTLSASTTIPGGTYAWTGPAPATTPAGTTPTSSTTSVSAAGTYTVVVTDPVSGCTATNTTTVTAGGTPPTVSIATPGTISCANPSITLTTTATPGVTYAWSGGGTGATKTVTGAGTYTVTVTGAGGCTATASTTVTGDNTPPTVSINAHSNITCLNPSVTLNTTVTPANVTYTWSSSASGTPSTTVTIGGSYSVTVTNPANGCTATTTTTVTQSTTPPTVSIATPVALTCTNTTVTLTALAAGTITYAWSGGTASGNTTLVTIAGSYTVTATNASGCTATASANVTSNTTPPTVSIAPAATVTCSNPASTLTASSPGTVTYAWSGGGTGATKNVTAGGTYTVTATGTNGCTATTSVVVDENQTPPTVSINPHADITCLNPSVTLNTTVAPANVTYTWSSSASGTSSTTVNTGGSYSVTVTDPLNGCTATASTTITQNSTPPTVSIATPATITCTNTTVTLTASSPNTVTYSWSGGTATGNITAVTTGGSYTVTATDGSGCTATASANVTQNTTPPTVSIAAAADITCANTSTTLIAQPLNNLTFAWSGGGTGAIKNVTAGGTYTVTATNTAGCTATASIVVNENKTPPIVSIDPHGGITCANPSVTLNTTTIPLSVTYAWSNSASGNSTSANASGGYSVTVTDPANGCTATASTTVAQNTTPPTVSIATPGVLSCSNLSVLLTASSPDNVTYNWSSSSAIATTTVAASGTYTVTATDGNGCTATASVTVTQNATIPTANISSSAAQLNCATITDTLTATSNAAGATFAWSNGTQGDENVVTTPGLYVVTITDNGCSTTASINVTLDTIHPIVDIASPDALSCTITRVFLSASTNGNASFAWSNGDTGPTISVQVDQQYIVTATDANGCTGTDTVVVTKNTTQPTVSIATPQVLGCALTSTTLTASSPDVVTYEWDNGSTTANNTVSAGGNYSVIVTHASGCTASATVTVIQNTVPPTVSVNTPATLTCATPSQTLTTTSQNGVTFVWNDNSTNPSLVVSTGGTYSVTATNAAGCTASATIVVNQTSTPPTVTIATPTPLTCIVTSSTLTASSPNNVTYLWDNSAATATNTVTTAGQYSVTATDGAGCTATASVTITQNTTPPGVSIATPVQLTCTVASVTLTASSPDNVTYTWASGSGATNTVTTAGPYTVTATNSAGCTATASATVTQNIIPPTVSIATPAQINCTNNSVTLTASSPDNVTYQWDNASITATSTVTGAGTYTVTATNAAGCTATTSATVTENKTAPTVSIAAPATLTCANALVTITASSPDNVTYVWSSGTGATATTSSAGTYSVTATGANGCTATASAIVAQDVAKPTVGIAQPDTITCSAGKITLTANAANTNATFEWSNAADSAITEVTTAGTYYVTVTNPTNGCAAIDSVSVAANTNAPGVYAGEDTVLSTGGVLLTATSASGNVNFEWSNQATTATTNITQAGTFAVVATDTTNGCSSTDSVTVRDIQNTDIKFPNVFTPNGDGTNDIFFPRTTIPTSVVIKEFRVYNRWGALIHNNPNAGWDGTFLAVGQPSETYLFFVKYEAPEQGSSTVKEYFEEGSFSLLR
jgi:gliding motility-associated-like protein